MTLHIISFSVRRSQVIPVYLTCRYSDPVQVRTNILQIHGTKTVLESCHAHLQAYPIDVPKVKFKMREFYL